MSAEILDGLSLAREMRKSLAVRVQNLRAAGVAPRLDVIVAAQDPASVAYVKMKRHWCNLVDIEGDSYDITADTTQDELISLILRLNSDSQIHGVLLQHPLPKHLDEHEALLTLGSEKDVDGITPRPWAGW